MMKFEYVKAGRFVSRGGSAIGRLLKRLQPAGVLHKVDGGGGGHGAEAFQQAEHEEDEGFVVR